MTSPGSCESAGPKTQAQTSDEQWFKHSALHLSSSSIRLIQVIPSSPLDDLICCKIKSVSIESKYTCLSYTWGSEYDTRSILLNGKIFKVRQNLWDFLKVAQSGALGPKENKSSNESDDPEFDFQLITSYLWIDALCIDQENVLEKNHQVQRMGAIYENAQCVVAWMGIDSRSIDWRYPIVRPLTPLRLDESTLDIICNNGYWKRAWITQELLLARDIYFLVDKKAIDPTALIQALEQYKLRWPGNYQVVAQVLDNITERRDKCTIFENIWRFRSKACALQHDVVYSLLSISNDGHRLQVKYDQTLFQLALEVIREYKDDFCICQAKVVFDALGPVWEMAMPETCEPMVRLHVDALPRDHRLEEDVCSACSDWIDANTSNPPRKQPITEIYYYCLGCQHPFSRIQPPNPGLHRHGHLKLAPKKFGRYKEEQDKAAWQVFWMAPRLKKAIKSTEHVEAWTKQPNRVTVVNVDTSGQAILDLPLKFFAWDAHSFDAQFQRMSLINDATVNHQSPIRNPKWEVIVESFLEKKSK